MFDLCTSQKARMIATFPPIYNGGVIRVFQGNRPSYSFMAENTNGATLIGLITNNGLPLGAPNAGLILQADSVFLLASVIQNWLLTASGNGNTNWWRYCANPNDAGNLNFEAERFQGDCGVTGTTDVDGNPYELQLPSLAVSVGQQIGPISLLYTIPPVITGET